MQSIDSKKRIRGSENDEKIYRRLWTGWGCSESVLPSTEDFFVKFHVMLLDARFEAIDLRLNPLGFVRKDL